MDQTYDISGMHCASCVERISAALKPFAQAVRVTLNPPQAVLTEARTRDVTALAAALAKVGGYHLKPAAPRSDVAGAPGQQPPRDDRATKILPGIAAAASPVNDDAKVGLESWLATYYPLLLIAGYIAVASLAGTFASGTFNAESWMLNFMAGFFLVFSAFKFLDPTGFADAYSTYDLLAQRWRGYGFIYPFLELGLGLAYLFRFQPELTHLATIALMGFSSLGVIGALRQKRTIQCACLGTVLKLPMSTITLAEDLGMAGMALASLMFGGHI